MRLRHTGDSANISWYEELTAGHPKHHVEILRTDVRFLTVDGKRTVERLRLPTFSIRVTCWKGETQGTSSEVARWTYEPKTKPKTYRLPDRTVSRLITEKLEQP